MTELERASDIYDEGFDTLDENEIRLHDIIFDYLETLPSGYFEDHTLDELNEHFGGKGDNLITERLRKVLSLAQNYVYILNELDEIYDSLPAEDEE